MSTQILRRCARYNECAQDSFSVPVEKRQVVTAQIAASLHPFPTSCTTARLQFHKETTAGDNGQIPHNEERGSINIFKTLP